MTSLSSQPHIQPPWWRDERILKIVLQVAFVIAVVVVFGILTQNLTNSLRRLGITFGFRFLGNSANFGITEGIPYDPSESYLKAFVVGVVNTIWLSSISIVLATVMGMILGVARLSSNWLARQLATVITEIFRNIPVLLIVIFWYQGVILTLPAVRNSYSIGGFFFISQRGINLPSLDPSGWLIPTVAILVAAAWGIRKLLLTHRPDVGPIQRNSLVGLGVLLLAVACWILFPEPPLRVDIPVLDRFNFRGGTQLSAEFTAMMLGLVTYTGCYIAEVVRGSFLAVQRGQWEASRAIGLTELSTFQLVIVPQALRIMIPSLNTQYLTLIKNSSLSIAVGFSDLFNISSTIINQSGRSVEMFAIIMATYLAINLVVSYGMNWINARVKLVEQ